MELSEFCILFSSGSHEEIFYVFILCNKKVVLSNDISEVVYVGYLSLR